MSEMQTLEAVEAQVLDSCTRCGEPTMGTWKCDAHENDGAQIIELKCVSCSNVDRYKYDFQLWGCPTFMDAEKV